MLLYFAPNDHAGNRAGFVGWTANAGLQRQLAEVPGKG